MKSQAQLEAELAQANAALAKLRRPKGEPKPNYRFVPAVDQLLFEQMLGVKVSDLIFGRSKNFANSGVFTATIGTSVAGIRVQINMTTKAHPTHVSDTPDTE